MATTKAASRATEGGAAPELDPEGEASGGTGYPGGPHREGEAPPPDEGAARAAEADARATLRTAVIAVAIAAGIITIASLAIWGPGAAVGVGSGGILATANLYVFVRVGRGLLAGGRRSRFWLLMGLLKFAALIAAVYLLLYTGVASGLGLVIGYGALPIGIVIANFLAPRSSDEPPKRRSAKR